MNEYKIKKVMLMYRFIVEKKKKHLHVGVKMNIYIVH